MNIFRSSRRIVDELRQDKRIWITGLMVSWFWLIGAIILSILPTMVKEVLGSSEIIVMSYLAIFAVALGADSAVAEVPVLGSGKIDFVGVKKRVEGEIEEMA